MKLRATLTIRNEAMIAARERLGLSQKKIGELADVNVQTYAAFEALRFDVPNVQQVAERIAGALGLDIKEVLPPESAGKVYESKQFRVFEAEPSNLLECGAKHRLLLESSDPLDQVDLKESMSAALDSLTFREREILKLRYGLNEHNLAYTLEETARIFKVTRERVRQIEAKAIVNMRKGASARKLEAFL